ncbi:MAG: diguanylate cyclase [Ruminococcus sp.]|nr:diguanylate cyclase [Ruminococcus sp.]
MFERVVAALTAANEKPYPITASLGVSVRALSELTDYEEVINEADEIMYRNKTAKKYQRT